MQRRSSTRFGFASIGMLVMQIGHVAAMRSKTVYGIPAEPRSPTRQAAVAQDPLAVDVNSVRTSCA